MFQKGDCIVYGSTGVCRIKAVGPLGNMRGADRQRLYYTLDPLYEQGVIYAPVDCDVFMRPILSRRAVDELISKIPDIREDRAFNSCDQRMLSDYYRAFFRTHNCEDLVQLIKTVYAKNKHSQETGKKVGQTDQRYKKHAEELLYGEFAVALGIPVETVVDYISDRLSHPEQT